MAHATFYRTPTFSNTTKFTNTLTINGYINQKSDSHMLKKLAETLGRFCYIIVN